MKHTVKNGFHTHPVRINLIGVGGGGSLVLSGLVRLHLAMKSLGHPYGLDVEVWDPDRVSSANIGRQLFAASEIGLNKAEALVNRYNLGFALNWKAHPERYHNNRGFDVLIACVDSRRSRKEIFQTLPKKNGPYVLDGGCPRHMRAGHHRQRFQRAAVSLSGAADSHRYQNQGEKSPELLPCGIAFHSGTLRKSMAGHGRAGTLLAALPQRRTRLPRILHQSRHRSHESRPD